MNKFVRSVIFADSPTRPYSSDWILLVLRIMFGVLMLVHGCQKISNYDMLVETFPDPIGLGGALSFQLAIFAEFACALAVIFGFMFRLALIPLIVTMLVATFVAMAPMGWAGQELPAIFLLVYLLLMVSGPGRYSLDHLFR